MVRSKGQSNSGLLGEFGKQKLTIIGLQEMLGDIIGTPVLQNLVANLGVVVTKETVLVGSHELIVPGTQEWKESNSCD